MLERSRDTSDDSSVQSATESGDDQEIIDGEHLYGDKKVHLNQRLTNYYMTVVQFTKTRASSWCPYMHLDTIF